jgi:hypothetical protein
MIFEFLKNWKFGGRDTVDGRSTPYGEERARAEDQTIIRSVHIKEAADRHGLTRTSTTSQNPVSGLSAEPLLAFTIQRAAALSCGQRIKMLRWHDLSENEPLLPLL